MNINDRRTKNEEMKIINIWAVDININIRRNNNTKKNKRGLQKDIKKSFENKNQRIKEIIKIIILIKYKIAKM